MISPWLLYTTIFAGLLSLLYHFLRKNEYREKINKIPGPVALPFLGNIGHFIKGTYQSVNVVQALDNEKGIARLWFGNNAIVVITDPNYLETYYTSIDLIDRPIQYKGLESILGSDNVLTTSGDAWRKALKITKKTFHSIPLETFFSISQKRNDILLTELKSIAKTGYFQYIKMETLIQFSVFMSILLDVEVEEVPEIVSKMFEYFETLNEIAVLRGSSPLHYFDSTFSFTTAARILTEIRKAFDLEIRESMAKARKTISERKLRNEPIPEKFIHNMLTKYPEEPMDSHVITFFATGVETVSQAIGFIMILLALHPDTQERVYREDLKIREKIGQREMTIDDLSDYLFLESVIKESLRLFSPVVITGKRTSNDVQFGEYTIPKDTSVFANVFSAHRNPKYFEDPSKFDPDRFFLEQDETKYRYVFEPFNAGRRVCAGTKIAWLTIKLRITAIVRTFKVYSAYKNIGELEKNLASLITLKDKDGVRIRLEER